jgi:hypothetical protein
VVDEHGVEHVIPVPRFLCRGRGPRGRGGTTISVLPVGVAPRRKWSLGLVGRVVKRSLAAALDELAAIGVTAEPRQVRRWIELLGRVGERLRMHPVPEVEIGLGGGGRRQALEVVRAFEGSSPPFALIMAFQQRWGHPLLDIRMS